MAVRSFPERGAFLIRQLNVCGFSLETIAAEYETDQALKDADDNPLDLYFVAAWKVELRERMEDASNVPMVS